MVISRLYVENIFGFKKFQLPLTPFTVLVGLNNGGKTSLLRTLRFAIDAIQPATFGPRQFDLQAIFNKNGISNPDALRFGHVTPNSIIQVDFQVAPNVRVEAKATMTQRECKVTFNVNGTDAGKLLPDDAKSALEPILDYKVEMLASVSGMPPENLLDFTSLQGNINSGRFAETWRNRFHWASEQNRPAQTQRIVDRLQESLPDVRLNPPRRTRTQQPQVEVSYDEDGIQHDIAASGAGLRTLVSLNSAVELSGASLLLMDEPDAHLHSSIQRHVARFLADRANEECQIVVSTHAPDFIEEVPLDSLVWIDRRLEKGNRRDSRGKVLVDLGAISKNDAVQFLGADTLLYVEGGGDRLALAALLKRCGKEGLWNRSRLEILDGHGNCKNLPVAIRIATALTNTRVAVVVIRDADYLELHPKGSETEADNVLELRLPCKELENLFIISPESIYAAANEAARHRERATTMPNKTPSLEQVQKKIDECTASEASKNAIENQWLFRWIERHPLTDAGRLQEARNEFTKYWSDAEWRRRCCPGKMALRAIRGWLQAEYRLTVTPSNLLDAYEPSDELKNLIERADQHVNKIMGKLPNQGG
jgi:predicted ATPase